MFTIDNKNERDQKTDERAIDSTSIGIQRFNIGIDICPNDFQNRYRYRFYINSGSGYRYRFTVYWCDLIGTGIRDRSICQYILPIPIYGYRYRLIGISIGQMDIGYIGIGYVLVTKLRYQKISASIGFGKILVV